MTTKTKTNGHNIAADLMPPHDREAEMVLLGNLIMVEPQAIYEVAAIVQPDQFYSAANGLIFRAMMDLAARGEPLDIVAIMAELRRHGHADIGEGQYKAELYLVKLTERAIYSQGVEVYARIIAEMATRRALINAASTVARLAWDEGQEIGDVAEQAQTMIYNSIQRRTRRGLNHIGDGMLDYLARLEARFDNPVEVTGLATGLVDLDRLLNGLKPQELVLIAGRTGMGKTALMMAIADYMSVVKGKAGAFFSLEMSKDELIGRLLSRRTGINTQTLARGGLTGEQQERVYLETGRISEAPLYISDKPAQTMAEIRAECLRQASLGGLDYVMIDYLGLISVPGARSRYEAISDAARGSKNLAKELEAPTIAAAQLNRQSEHSSDKRPVLSNLRDSGELEESADVVALLYRDGYYNEQTVYPNQGEVNVAKHRNGPTGVIDLYWNNETASYHNLEHRALELPY